MAKGEVIYSIRYPTCPNVLVEVVGTGKEGEEDWDEDIGPVGILRLSVDMTKAIGITKPGKAALIGHLRHQIEKGPYMFNFTLTKMFPSTMEDVKRKAERRRERRRTSRARKTERQIRQELKEGKRKGRWMNRER